MSQAMVECTEFQGRYLDMLRGWDRLAHAQDPEAIRIIDMDVAPERPPREYDRIEDIRSDLEDLAGSVPSDTADRAVVEQIIRGNLFFLRAENGERFDFLEYMENTVGFRPQPVQPGEIEISAERLDEQLRDGGLRYSSESRDTYLARCVIRDPREIRAAVEAGVIAARSNAASFLDDVSAPHIAPEYVRKDTYGVSELTLHPDHTFRWTVNLMHERHPLDLGRINMLDAHEITGHAFHITSLASNIQAGNTDPIVGAVTIPTPYAVQAEALAQNAEFLFTDDTWHNTCRALYHEHVMLVLYDAHWRVNHDEDPKAIADSIKNEDRLPFEPETFYKPEFIAALRDSPYYRAYVGAYHVSGQAMKPLRASGMELEQQRQVLNLLYNKPVLPQELTDIVARAAHTRVV